MIDPCPLQRHAPDGPATPARASSVVPGLVLALLAALVSLSINLVVPPFSALLIAILLGVLLANTAGVPTATEPGLAIAAKRLLRLGVALLGLQLSLREIADLGAEMIVVVVAVVGFGVMGTLLIGRLLRMKLPQRLLIAVGFSICGAAAVAAVEGVIDDKDEEDAATAIALVVLFGTLMIGIVPLLAGALGLPERTAGLWAGASTHEVAQVVAATGIIGPAALKSGAIVKLARVLMLAPVIAVINLTKRRYANLFSTDATANRPPIVPLFVAGFLAMVFVRTAGVLPASAVNTLKLGDTLLLSAAMFALGAGVKVAQLRSVGGRPVILGTLSTILVASIGLAGALLAG